MCCHVAHLRRIKRNNIFWPRQGNRIDAIYLQATTAAISIVDATYEAGPEAALQLTQWLLSVRLLFWARESVTLDMLGKRKEKQQTDRHSESKDRQKLWC